MPKMEKTLPMSLTAATADKHQLYEDSVQNPEAEVEFIDRVFTDEFGRSPRDLREDFCGTLNLGCRWVGAHPENTALGVDLDQPTLDWGREHNVLPLGDGAARVTMIRNDVRNVSQPSVDVLAATNFSWWGFHTRDDLLAYFRNCRRSLREDGLLMLDIYGGPEAQVLQFEEREYEDFTYIWDQDVFNPLTHEYRCKIHFRFPDGTEIQNAFEYHWRLWTVPEVRELLSEAGFRKIEVFWEGADDEGEPDGIFQVSEEGDTSPAWIAYLVAFR